MVGHLPQSGFDPLRQFQAILPVEPVDLLLVGGLQCLDLGTGVTYPLPSLDRLLEPMREIHGCCRLLRGCGRVLAA